MVLGKESCFIDIERVPTFYRTLKMINEFEFFHGAVFSRILHSRPQGTNLKAYSSGDNAAYVLNEKIGLYIKHSSRRLSPWRFTFLPSHQKSFAKLKEKYGHTYLILVCNNDGIVILSFVDLMKVLDDNIKDAEWISVTRGKGKMYAVKGSDGKLEFKVGRNMFQQKLFEHL